MVTRTVLSSSKSLKTVQTKLFSINGYSHHTHSSAKRCYCLGTTSRAQLLKTSAWLFHPIGDKAPPAARDSSKVSRTSNRRWYPRTGSRLHSSLSLSVGFPIQNETVGVTQPAPLGTRSHAGFFYLLPRLGFRMGAWASVNARMHRLSNALNEYLVKPLT